MIKKYFIFFLLFSFCSIYGQKPPYALCNHMYKPDQLTSSAQYAEGPDEMYHFIYKNLSWKCGEKSLEGTVILDFIVDRVGKIWDIKIQQSISPCLDDEVIRAVKLMPSWVPAIINGSYVCSEVFLPVRFRLGWEEQYQRKKDK